MCQWCNRSAVADRITAGLTAHRREFLAYAAVIAATAGSGGRALAATSTADTIFHNGPIYPMSSPGAKAEAVAVASGKIIAVGSTAKVMARRGPTTRLVDLKGRTMLPGLIDPHNHVSLSALLAMLFIDVGYARYKTKADALAAMKLAASKAQPGAWLAFGSYDNLLQRGDFSMAELDAVSTANPVFLFYVNGHVGAGNTLAFQRAGVTKATGTLPGGGYFGRGPDGSLNGMIYNEPALLKFLDIAIPKPNPADLAKAITAYARQAAAAGITTIHEPGTVKPEWVEMLAKLSNSLPIRYSASFSTDMVEQSKAFAALGPSSAARIVPGSRFSLYGMKYWGDGSNQAESAAQTQPYLGTDKRGSLGYTAAEAIGLCTKAKQAGWTIMVHSQGDAAIDQILDAIEAVYGAHPATGLNRVEHATMARADQIQRMQRLGCEPSFMMDFVYLYGADYRDKIFGAPRAEFMVPVGAAAKAGIGYSLHTDNPAAGLPLNPLRLVQTAVTRRCMADNSVIGADLAITVDEALRSFTAHAARHLGMGAMIGTLEAGKDADFTLLESDPYAVAVDDISGIKISETWLAGASTSA